MSKFFAIFSKNGLTQSHKTLINSVLDHNSGLTPGSKKSFCDNNLFLQQVDYQQYQQPAWTQNDLQIATLVGHPMLSANRSQDLNQLFSADNNLFEQLSNAEGAFCFFNYDRVQKRVTVATDALGLRPFYFMEYDGGTIISTCLKTLQQLPLTLTMDQEGLVEFATLGYYLFDHTPYQEVKCAKPGQSLLLNTERDVTLFTYFDWLHLAQQSSDVNGAIKAIDKDFKAICEKYTSSDQSVLTTLSGGLDSRLIACELKRQNKQIFALNFSQNKTQDLFCAQAFANENDIDLEVIKVQDTQALSVEQRLGKHWRKPQHKHYNKVDRPQMAWSGNGGSVGLGVIYYSDPVYQAAKTQNVEKLVDAYLQQQYAYVPNSVVNQADASQLQLKQNLIKSFDSFGDLPLEKAYYLFLLLNDQHHHLAVPYENIDEYQMEFCLPIYSWKVLRHVLSLPIEETRRHKFYLTWLSRCYPEALTTPWQAYPGHIPCPIKLEGMDQWQINRQHLLTGKILFNTWKQLMAYRRHQLLNKSKLTILCVLHALGIKNAYSNINLAKKLTQW